VQTAVVRDEFSSVPQPTVEVYDIPIVALFLILLATG